MAVVADLREGSEYGGVPGSIQPPPHSVLDSVAEQVRLVYLTDPADPTSSPEKEYARIQKDEVR